MMKKPEKFPIEQPENILNHWKNLIECAQQGRKDTWSPMDLAFRTQTILQMAMMAYRDSVVARFDARARRILT